MNDTIFLEAARKLGERMMREGGSTPAERIGYGFRLVTARPPKPREAEILLAGFRRYAAYFHDAAGEALKYVSQGKAPRDERIQPAELAAYATVASLLLNLDEAVTKE